MMIHIAGSVAESFLKPTPAEEQLQPNAVDLKLDKVFATNKSFHIEGENSPFVLSEEDKTHREKTELQPDEDGYFTFDQGESYEVTFEGTVTIGAAEAGFVITRSTLNRNGVFLTSGLYDSGYGQNGGGVMAGALHNLGGPTRIKKGTRIGQFLLWKAEALHKYNGSYGRDVDGNIKAEDQRYFK